jgi:hypothetical protein
VLLKLFHKIQSKPTKPNSFYEVSITLITNPKIPQNYRAICLMNIDAKILNKQDSAAYKMD